MSRLLTFALVAAAVLGFVPAPAQAAFPEKEIRIIQPYPAGGMNDLVARKVIDIIAQEKLLPKPVITTGITGAVTRNALNAVKQAEADGHTLLLHHTAFVTSNVLGQIPDSYKDFAIVCQLLQGVTALDVAKGSKWKTVQELIADIKANPGKISVGVGIGSVTHVALMHFLSNQGIKLNAIKYIPLGGGAETFAALIGGKVDFTSVTGLGAVTSEKSGETRILVSLSTDKLEAMGSTPNLADLGMPQGLTQRVGIFAPKGTPEAVVAQLRDIFKKVSETQAFKDFARDNAMTVSFADGDAMAKGFDEDAVVVKRVAQDAGMVK